MAKYVVKQTVTSTDQPYMVDFIAEHCEVSKSKIKKALIYGGGWLKKKNAQRWSRCRKAKQVLEAADSVEFYCDPQLLDQEFSPPQLLQTYRQWGIWYKPPNLLSQGTKYGDFHSMEVQVAKLSGQNKVNLIHRLDREASGIMVFAYSKALARSLSALWREAKVEKFYHIEVLGDTEPSGAIHHTLDGKPAMTEFIKLKSLETTSLLEVKIHTGRLHQIRRHMELIGHPVMGDPRYGKDNKNNQGMRLVATRVKFELEGKQVDCELPASLYPFN